MAQGNGYGRGVGLLDAGNQLALGALPAGADGCQARRAAGVGGRAFVGGDGRQRGLRLGQAGSQLAQHKARKLVGLQLVLRLRAAGAQGVAVEVVAHFVGQDADTRPVGVAGAVDGSHELRVVEQVALAVGDHGGRVGHLRGGAQLEAGLETNYAGDFA